MHQTDSESGTAIGWISTAELFLLVAVILLTSVLLYQARLTTVTEDYSGLKNTEQQVRNDRDKLSQQVEQLQARLREQAYIWEDRWRTERERAKLLESDAENLRVALRNAKAEGKKALTTLEARLKSYENRFEGLRLEGQRVVFLVDRSGSMGSVDERTLDPEKWPTVCDTVRRIMRSLPDLNRYQVITVAEDVRYPLGQDGRWLEYDPHKTADEVFKALSAVKPEDGTNLYAGLEAAFKYHDLGLQAIYLFSDGLPNLGPGLTMADEKEIQDLERGGKAKLAERVRGEKLGAYLRDTIREKWNRSDTKVRIESVGFFYESPDLGSFLWGLSRANGGNFVGMRKP
jgi:hypothetical protein